MKKTMVAQIEAKIGEQTPEILARELNVNGEKSTMLGFLYTNLCDKDVEHIAVGDAKTIIAMNVGEMMYIGLSEIIRIK